MVWHVQQERLKLAALHPVYWNVMGPDSILSLVPTRRAAHSLYSLQGL